jgi:hypothetical protein
MSLDVSADVILPAALRPWGLLRLLTEMSTRNLPESYGRRTVGRRARTAVNLTAICEPNVYKM